MKQIEKLQPKDVLKAARKYLTPKSLSMVLLTPPDFEKHGGKSFQNFQSAFAKIAKARPKPQKTTKKQAGGGRRWTWKSKSAGENELTKIHLPNGATGILRPSLDTPVVSVRLAVPGGARWEPVHLRGGTELLARVWTSGAGKYDEKSFNEKIDSLAAGISAFGGRHTIGLNLTALHPLFHEADDLFWTAFFDPHFSEAAVQREVKAMMDQLRLRKDNPAQIAILNFSRTLFGDHPYGWDPYGDEETLAHIDGNAIRHLWSQMISPEGLVVVASGAVNAERWTENLRSRFGGWKKPPASVPVPAVNYPRENEFVFEESKKAQSHIVVGYPGLKITDQRKYALQVLQSVLAGQGGRLFVELRDKASLAYSVAPLRMDGLDGGYFGAYIGCSPEKSKKAIEMLQAEFQKLQDSLIEPEELERAQLYLIGRHDIELQRNSNITSSILFDQIYGIDYRETYRFAQHIRSVSTRDVRELAGDLFSRAAVISVVGSEQPWP